MIEWLASDDGQALLLSLKVASLATLAILPPGVFLAFVLARKRFPGHGVVNAAVHLPLILPPVVTGYLLLVTMGRKGPIGAFLDQHFGLVFAFRWTGAALAAGVMALPFLVRAVRLAFESIDPRLEDAAATLGARPLTVFFTITLPLALPGVLAGAVMGFAKAIGEFGATITFVSNIPGQTRTLPTAIYTALSVPGGESQAALLVGISLVVALGAIALSEALSRRVARRIAGRGAR